MECGMRQPADRIPEPARVTAFPPVCDRAFERNESVSSHATNRTFTVIGKRIRKGLVMAGLSGTAILLLAVCCQDANAQDRPQRPPQNPEQVRPQFPLQIPAPGTTSPQDPAIPKDIKAIRNQLGGGVTSALSGMLDESTQAELQQAFDTQIRELESSQAETDIKSEQPGQVQAGRHAPNLPVAPAAQGTIFGTRTAAGSVVAPVNGMARWPAPAPTPVSPALPGAGLPRGPAVAGNAPQPLPRIQQLRHAARRIETVAADLEDTGEFDHADQLREIAQQLRQRARLLMPPEDPSRESRGGAQPAR